MKLTSLFAAAALLILQSSLALAWNAPNPEAVQDDSQLTQAINSERNEFFIEAADLVVTKVLPDDNQGLAHQKWQARDSQGDIVSIVYNIDLGEHIPIQVGDHFTVAGQFLWLGHYGMVHWTHYDPRHKRPDGYVYLNGKAYGLSGH